MEKADNDLIIKVSNLLFKMAMRIVLEGKIADSKIMGQPIIEKDIGRGIKARFREVYGNTCNIEGNDGSILVHHHKETRRGTGGFTYENNLVWIALGQGEIFRALWGSDNVDTGSLIIMTTPEAASAFAKIQEKWQKLEECDKHKDQQ